jgi:hypothetical protein
MIQESWFKNNLKTQVRKQLEETKTAPFDDAAAKTP